MDEESENRGVIIKNSFMQGRNDSKVLDFPGYLNFVWRLEYV